MSKGTKIVILVLIGILIIAGILFWFLKSQKDIWPDKPVDETAPVEKVEVAPEEAKIAQFSEPTEKEKIASSAKAVAQMFVERFGTYTNHSNFSSISELTMIMTGSMKNWVEDTYLPKLREEHDPKGFFYRITAKAPVVIIETQTVDSMSIRVSAQREEQIGTEEVVKFIQDIVVNLVKDNNQWLIDSAYWQERK